MDNPKYIPVINRSQHSLPAYQTAQSAGMDLNAWIENGSIEIMPGERVLIPTGIQIALPEGYEAQIRPRSGLALKKGVTVLNSPGTIDADYRGDVGVILINHGHEPVRIDDGDRIAQMVVAPFVQAQWSTVDTLPETERGLAGFGHTGNKQ